MSLLGERRQAGSQVTKQALVDWRTIGLDSPFENEFEGYLPSEIAERSVQASEDVSDR